MRKQLQRRAVTGTIAITALCCLVSCAGSPSPAPSPAGSSAATSGVPSSGASSAAPATTGKPFESLGAKFGALDTVLTYCAPGLPGSPRSGCDKGRIQSGVTELTTALRSEIGSQPDPARFADVSAAVTALDSSIAGLDPCGNYFSTGAGQAQCGVAWNAVVADWRGLKLAARWPTG